MKKLLTVATVIGLMTGLSAMAAIEPVLIHLDDGESYTVPAGKALLIHNVRVLGSSAFLNAVSGGDTNSFTSSYFALNQGSTINPVVNWPLTFPENTRLDATVTSGYWIIVGYLVDYSDLYVSAQHEFETASRTDTTVTLGIKTQTAHPLRFSFESSSDLPAGWSPVTGAAVRPQADKTEYLVDVPVLNDIRFYRSKARPRE